MGARIIVQSGISSGTTHWIERAVVRIGSDPAADLCVPSPELEAHALTLEFRDGEYRIYNRSGKQLYLGGHVLAPNQYDCWLDTDILELSDGVQLALEFDDDLAPSPQPMVSRADEHFAAFAGDSAGLPDATHVPTPLAVPADWSDGEQAATSPAIKSSATLIQLGVTALCVAGCILLLVRHQLRQSTVMDRPQPSFSNIVREALDAGEEVPSDLIRRLQYAESALVRGNRSTARKQYRYLRDCLLQRQPMPDVAAGGEADIATQITELVEFRLAELANAG